MSFIVYEEDVMNDLKAYLVANLDTHLTGIENLKADGIPLPDIKKYLIVNEDILGLQLAPAALMNPGDTEYEPLSLGCDLLKLPVILTIAIKGGKKENLVTKALRYVSAIRQCINADRTAGETLERSRVASINFYTTPPGQEAAIIIDAVIDTEKEIPIGS